MAKRSVPLLGTTMLALTLALGTAACGSSPAKTTNSGSGSSTSSASSSTASGSSATSLPSAATVPPVPGGHTLVGGPVPAVTGATNLAKEPSVAASSGTPPTKVLSKDLVVGTGNAATASNTVKVQYVGAFYPTGKTFDASWTDAGPYTVTPGGVIAGFGDAIVGMKVGGRREVVIPPAEGYGSAGQPPTIPANATLVFVIDLLSIS